MAGLKTGRRKRVEGKKEEGKEVRGVGRVVWVGWWVCCVVGWVVGFLGKWWVVSVVVAWVRQLELDRGLHEHAESDVVGRWVRVWEGRGTVRKWGR